MKSRPFTRRRFLGTAAAAASAALITTRFDALLARAAASPGYGPLVPDPDGLLDLPAGFKYRALSTAMLDDPDHARFASRLSNGDPVPALHDGMGAFAGRRGHTILVRNHETDLKHTVMVDPRRVKPYDAQGKSGTITLWIDKNRQVVKSFASLSGLLCACAGGVTPWGTWLTAEECVYLPGPKDPVNHDLTPLVSQRHGYMFEVDPKSETLVDPVPIQGMGRFYHEAAAVDPATGYVYLTEDRSDGLLYRYRPDVLSVGLRSAFDIQPGDMARGGVLEALRITTRPAARTHNRDRDDKSAFLPGERFKVDWVRIPNPDPDMDQERDPGDRDAEPLDRRPRTAETSTRAQGFRLGAAQFTRAEGIVFDHGAIVFACTDGGRARLGQLWRLDLARQEVALMREVSDKAVLEAPDNLCVAPFGDLIVCEDGDGIDRVIGLTPQGATYVLARNAFNDEEFAGACFSPDEHTLFVNLRNPGITFAIWGPWGRRG